MFKEIDYVRQLNFLDKVPLLDSPITNTYNSSLNQFYQETSFDAMRIIGEIYVPRFSEKNHEKLEEAALWVYIHKDKITEGTFSEEDPEFVINCQNRLTYWYMAQTHLGVSDEARSMPVTFLSTDDNLRNDLRNVLNPVYTNLRKDSISLAHHEHGKDLIKLEERENTNSLILDRVNRMTMSNGNLYQEQGADMLIGWMIFKYCQTLGSRATKILSHKTSAV